MMKAIQFTNEEYKVLVKLLFIGEWVLNAQSSKPENEKETELLNKVFSHNDEFGISSWFTSFELGEYELKENVVLDILEEVDKFSNIEFWQTLIRELSDRDAEEFIAKSEDLSEEDFDDVSFEFAKLYEKEFEENGTENLRITDDFDASLN